MRRQRNKAKKIREMRRDNDSERTGEKRRGERENQMNREEE